MDDLIENIPQKFIKDKAIQLKDLLLSIFNIVIEQSKDLSKEYLEREAILQGELLKKQSLEKEVSKSLNELIQKSSLSESQLNQIRQEQSKVNNEISQLENQKSLAELDVKVVNEKITELKIEIGSHSVHLQNAFDKIQNSGQSLDQVHESEYAEYTFEQLEADLDSVRAKISRLGAINLAAPDEIDAETKRKEELDLQYNDLTDALEKLNQAISKIDKETKEKFIQSFNAVNARLQEMFPILFGGGRAELFLTESNYLHAGVKLMAQPPGKKNSSISQLSGGEKAMTALALVFALFELNSAPFCLLDEVDAPLDDLNTSRFIKMVDQMSQKIQFICITHNKVSMEKSDFLMGVTMQEAGVSRVVSVDVKQAVEFAAK